MGKKHQRLKSCLRKCILSIICHSHHVLIRTNPAMFFCGKHKYREKLKTENQHFQNADTHFFRLDQNNRMANNKSTLCDTNICKCEDIGSKAVFFPRFAELRTSSNFFCTYECFIYPLIQLSMYDLFKMNVPNYFWYYYYVWV